MEALIMAHSPESAGSIVVPERHSLRKGST